MKRIRELNFKLLIAFDAIMRNKSISQAAGELGVSQPTVSNHVGRLRIILGDTLFVRTSHGVLPTPYAETIYPYVRIALDALQEGLENAEKFDPAQTQRIFTLIMTDIGEVTILPELMKMLNIEAPGISIRTINLPPFEVADALQSGLVDIAIAYMPNLESCFYQRYVFNTDYVCLVSDMHPYAGKEITREEFESSIHIVAEARGTGHYYLLEQNFESLKVRRNIGVRVPHFMSMPHIIAKTNLVATVPRKMVYAFRHIPNICILEHPIKLPFIDVKLLWHERYHNDQANSWLREKIYIVSKEIKWNFHSQ